ncbi:ATP-dependent RNA helicase SrmB [Colwellia psychrerythraea]|uniref:ATP-dependent RNA helicase SrmB n=1 Tax=Colwellia psychrerythraea TaxID=28229 RepID=A0A099KYJ4_COLPS|nr:ATP-dependent RNA helicase SrmB [Colwellia psychrerythraea]KGJ95616.1 DEAD/DEAH box helicase domain protein [Colwellia psychrerythraea]
MFEQFDLDSELLASIKKIGYTKPTSIQELVIPEAMSGKDVLASAPTGTGKTSAFLLPVAQHLLDYPRTKPGFPRVLILTPTRELAIQIGEDSEHLTELTKIKTGVITGGVNYGSHADILTTTTDILVATPGRLLEYIENEQFDAREIEILILDEADRMLDLGFSDAINRIVAEARWRKQTMLFSATLEGSGVQRFAKEVLNEPIFLESSPSRKEKAVIHQWIHLADDANHKLKMLVNTLKQEGVERTVVFANKRETVQYLSGKLYAEELPCVWLEGKMPQDKRNKAIERFKSGEIKVLVATDVAARGLDIDDISHVVNFDMPRKVDIYIHRIGRTGRAGNKGTAISLVEAHDMGVIGKIERYTKERLQRRFIQELRPKNKESRVVNKKAKIKLTASQKKAKAKKQVKKKAKRAKAAK